jgi:hypothetical protein
MPRYSERTDEGPVDFPICPGCHEIVYSEVGCLDCMTEPPPPCGVDWLGCGPQSIWHECRLYEGHDGAHACEHCTATSTTGVRA